MAMATGTALLLGGLVSAGSSIYGANKQAGSARSVAKSQNQAIDTSLDWEREQEARRQKEWDASEARNQDNWQKEVAREQMNLDRAREEDIMRDRRKEPYRVVGRAALSDLEARRQSSMKDLLPTGRI